MSLKPRRLPFSKDENIAGAQEQLFLLSGGYRDSDRSPKGFLSEGKDLISAGETELVYPLLQGTNNMAPVGGLMLSVGDATKQMVIHSRSYAHSLVLPLVFCLSQFSLFIPASFFHFFSLCACK